MVNKHRFSFSALIQPIRLPSGMQLLDNYAGEEAVASGFGITGDGKP